MEWIEFEKQKPKEKESIFAKYYGTEKWTNVMFRTCCYDLLFTIEHKGERFVQEGHMIDGKPCSNYLRVHSDAKAIAWMLYPNPYNK